ncbi:MAG: tRNA pseudouridine(55) synthase TruB [Thermoleophilaceae bacterium]|nr:tRNA pseudouridine(55) synthase TruB [Thermoleophilaceae bacterium]
MLGPRPAMVPAGVILYPKPPGLTSHDVVARVRRRLREASGGERVKVGHAGTLDPFATGLLLVLVGRATRAQRFLMALPKRYRVVARLGWRSDTGDRDGRLEHTGHTPDRVELPTGDILQRPPAFSAVRVGGERAYARARRGETVEPPPRPVSVYDWSLLRREGDRVELEVECSAGTYVRTLVSDLGDAYCEELERTAIGPFDLEDADPERIVPVARALAFLPERVLERQDAERAGHGVAVGDGDGAEARADHVRLTHEGALVAIAEPRGDELKPVVVFAP